MSFETVIEVDNHHIDHLNHLNHVETVRFIEQGRSDWLQMCGLYTLGVETIDGPPRYESVVVNINYNYRRECMLGELLRITTQPQHLGHKSYHLRHEIIKPDGSIAFDGQVISVVMDLTTRDIVLVPNCIARHFS